MAGYLGNIPSAVPLTSADIADGIITSAKIADGTIVNADINASAGIVTSKLSGALGITEADMWRLTANITADVVPISSNLERVDDASFAKIGTGMSVSSGTFSFPTTGLYQVSMKTKSQAPNDNIGSQIYATINNSTYDVIADALISAGSAGGSFNDSFTSAFVNVTNTSNVKVQFEIYSIVGSSAVSGDTNQNSTFFSFIRLGDSQ